MCLPQEAVAKAVMQVTDKHIANIHKFGRPETGYRTYNSGHEAWAVCKEELDELWDEIKGKGPAERIRKEAIDLAAAALAIVIEAEQLEEEA